MSVEKAESRVCRGGERSYKGHLLRTLRWTRCGLEIQLNLVKLQAIQRACASGVTMPSRSRRTIVYNLSGASASAREAFEHGLDLHSDEEDNAHLGSSPPGGSGRAARYRQQPSAFVDAHRYPGQEHQPRGAGDLLGGRGSERETVELLSLVELFPQADRTLVEEVPFCSS